MNPILKNTIAIIVGIVSGMIVNMGIIILGPSIIPYPEGVDFTNMESINAALPTYEFKHFIVPFTAHAIGTLVGAILTAIIAASHQMKLALVIGLFFLIGGIQMVLGLSNSPMAFNLVDLGLAYIPMAFIGAKIGGAKKK